MIKLTRLNNEKIVINVELIESIESTPDTKIMLTTGNQYIVKDSVDEITKKIVEYRAEIELQKDKLKQKLFSKE